MKIKKKKIKIITIILLSISLIGISIYLAKESIQKNNNSEIHGYYSTKSSKEITIKILKNSSLKDVIDLLNKNGEFHGVLALSSFKILCKMKKYDINIKPGKVTLKGKYEFNDLINTIRIPNNRETITITIPENIRTKKEIIKVLSKELDYNQEIISNYISDTVFLKKSGFNNINIPSIFIPNTYEVYKDVSIQELFNRLLQEYQNFWNYKIEIKDSLGRNIEIKRINQCELINLSPIEVSILASIVEEEQDQRIEERSIIAGLYLNRIRQERKLQSDPTLIFALGDFSIKRVLKKDKKIDSPFNTYLHAGLPPGPICIPSIHSIDAVLNADKHNYLFMCAKEDLKGYHNFSCCYKKHDKKTCNREESTHLENARKYQNELNKRKIKR